MTINSSRRPRAALALSLAMTLGVLSTTAWSGPLDVMGTYVTEEGDSHVEISDCGDGTPCGKVVWIDPDSLEPGQTPESLRTSASNEPVLGLQILSGFKADDDQWHKGEIYSPKVDKTYSSKLQRLDDQTLEVKGCIAFLCQTQIWKPVDTE